MPDPSIRDLAAARMYENSAKRLGVRAPAWPEAGPKTRAEYLASVDDVLDVLRTPSTAMILAGCTKAAEEQARPVAIRRTDAHDVFVAMVEAAKAGK